MAHDFVGALAQFDVGGNSLGERDLLSMRTDGEKFLLLSVLYLVEGKRRLMLRTGRALPELGEPSVLCDFVKDI